MRGRALFASDKRLAPWLGSAAAGKISSFTWEGISSATLLITRPAKLCPTKTTPVRVPIAALL